MLQLKAIPAFTDNYIWTLYDDTNCLVIDPGEAAPVQRFLDRSGTRLTHILVTHHHADHIGGLAELTSNAVAPITIIGPEDRRIPHITTTVCEGDKIHVEWLNSTFSVLEVPGHTSSHIAFYNKRWLFCGDTLFSAGCGRLFEGSPAQMQHSLDKLAALPDDLLVCCTHEYTLSNCRFALQVEPDNPALQARTSAVEQLRRDNKMTLPVTLAAELTYNPFLRSRNPAVINAAKQRLAKTDPQGAAELDQQEPHQILAVIRHWKDTA